MGAAASVLSRMAVSFNEPVTSLLVPAVVTLLLR
jgi:hypothetical protein